MRRRKLEVPISVTLCFGILGPIGVLRADVLHADVLPEEILQDVTPHAGPLQEGLLQDVELPVITLQELDVLTQPKAIFK